MAQTIKVKRGTRAQINTAASGSNLNVGEPYLITDENILAVGLSATTYEDIGPSAATSSAGHARSFLLMGG